MMARLEKNRMDSEAGGITGGTDMKRALGILAITAALGATACDGNIGSQLTGSGGFQASSSGSSSGMGAGDIGSSSGTPPCDDCEVESSGVGTGTPFDPDNNPSDGVGLDENGALVLDASNTGMPGIIWIANTNLSTVTKVDTETYQILGRYKIGTNDPSRTSVNSLGDVFVANRNGNSLTKISSAGDKCPDTNGDNQITTSTGFNDVLSWGQDDCVLWDVPIPNNPKCRGVAAQDVWVSDPIPDDMDNKTLEHYAWVGGTNHRTIYKYDGDNGNLLIQTESPSGVYGLALDGNGQLWISGNTDGSVIGRVDTNKCHDQASCDAAPVCVRNCATGNCACEPGCPTSCDDAVKERILVPNAVYGITVDFKQRVWIGGATIARYDPALPESQRYASAGNTGFVHGIAADADGWVWGAGGSNGVVRVDGDSLAFTTVPVGSAKGMAIDKDGKVWAVEKGSQAHVITPGQNGLDDYAMTPGAVGGLGDCYTYSDMTGAQLALAMNDPGWYREVFEGCQGQGTEWYDLNWNVETEPGTFVRFRGRSSNDLNGLDQAPWVPLAKIPSDTPPVSIADKFNDKNLAMGYYFELEVSLEGNLTPAGFVGPKVNAFSVSHRCVKIAN